MALAEMIETSAEATSAVNPAALRGRVDAIDDGRIYGWAWSPADPKARVEIQVFSGDELVASALADRARIDLRRNGVGDGAHAFDLELPAIPASEAGLRVVALDPAGGASLDLRLPPEKEFADAYSAAVSPALDRLHAAVDAQGLIQRGHIQALRELSQAARQFADLAKGDHGLGAAVEAIREGQERLAERLGQLEVFVVRFDGVIGGFQKRLDALASRDTHGMRGHLLVLAGGVGILCGVALAAALRM